MHIWPNYPFIETIVWPRGGNSMRFVDRLCGGQRNRLWRRRRTPSFAQARQQHHVLEEVLGDGLVEQPLAIEGESRVIPHRIVDVRLANQ